MKTGSAQAYLGQQSNAKAEVNDPNRTSFELILNSNAELWLVSARPANA